MTRRGPAYRAYQAVHHALLNRRPIGVAPHRPKEIRDAARVLQALFEDISAELVAKGRKVPKPDYQTGVLVPSFWGDYAMKLVQSGGAYERLEVSDRICAMAALLTPEDT